MVMGIKCPECGSTQIWKKGFVPTRAGRKTRYQCTVCAHSFYFKDEPKPKAKRGRKKKSG